ncbi:hypothetical protein C8J57DRAFT_1233078 [Mycena rebaudengoi]|nr:hypothetical protein C8J57DRAFT_1233078 [Mycena rebaudengoi]
MNAAELRAARREALWTIPEADGLPRIHLSGVNNVPSVNSDASDADSNVDAELPALVTPEPSIIGSMEKQRKKAYTIKMKQATRICKAKANAWGRPPKAKHSQDYRELSPERTNLDTSRASISASAWVGTRPKGKGKGRCRRKGCMWTTEELKEFGCRHIRWKGRAPKLILDIEGRIIAILLGRPDDPNWDAIVDDAHRAFERARRLALARGALRRKNVRHRRGNYTAISTGVSFGGGQQVFR